MADVNNAHGIAIIRIIDGRNCTVHRPNGTKKTITQEKSAH
ncbi:hypothetical protein [Rhizobium leguminosarum]|nr:hypothetical protein [Rhizobium leguminosarum]